MIDPVKPCCPTCGGELTDQFIWDFITGTFVANGVAVRFTHRQAIIFNAIWQTRHAGGLPTSECLADAAYLDDPDGSPANNLAQVHLWKMRKMLQPTGFTISYNTGKPRMGYRLERAAA